MGNVGASVHARAGAARAFRFPPEACAILLPPCQPPHERGARAHIGIRIFHPRRYDNLLRKFLVNRSDVIAAAAVVKFSHHGGVGATDQAHDAAFGAAVRTNIPDFNQHPVAVHGRAHRWRRNENISRQPRLQAFLERTGFGDDKTEAVAMHAQPADGEVLASSGLGNGIAVGIYLALTDPDYQLLQALGKFAAGVPTDAQLAHHLLEAGSAFGLALNLLQDVGIRNHGHFVGSCQIECGSPATRLAAKSAVNPSTQAIELACAPLPQSSSVNTGSGMGKVGLRRKIQALV